MEVNIELPVDEDGFIEYECPNCQKIFRLSKNLFTNSEDYHELYCPYCGLNSEIDDFYTTEFVEYAHALAERAALEELNRGLKSLERKTRNSMVKINTKQTKMSELEMLSLHHGLDNLIKCNKCNGEYKIEGEGIISYCPFCGEIK